MAVFTPSSLCSLPSLFIVLKTSSLFLLLTQSGTVHGGDGARLAARLPSPRSRGSHRSGRRGLKEEASPREARLTNVHVVLEAELLLLRPAPEESPRGRREDSLSEVEHVFDLLLDGPLRELQWTVLDEGRVLQGERPSSSSSRRP